MTEEGKSLAIQAGVVAGAFAIGAAWLFLTSDAPTVKTVLPDNSDKFSDQQQKSDGQLSNPTTIYDSATATTDNNIETPPNCDPTPPGYITSLSNCAIYELKQHPTEPGKLCAEKGSHDPDNERTLYGLGFAVSDGLQHPIVIVDPATNKIIGYFETGVAPTFGAMYSPANNESLACLYYGGVTSGILEPSIDQ